MYLARTLFILFFALTLLQCKSAQMVTEDSLLLEMTKTLCYGTCPAYKVKIYNSGKVEFLGEKFVPLIGEKNFELSDSDMSSIIQAIKAAELLSLKDKYYKDVSDLPTTYITYYHEGGSKKIMDYYGAPERLKELEKLIEKTILSYL